MGNDHSVLSEYEIEESPYAQIGLWTLHTAERRTGSDTSATVFTGKLRSYGKLSKEFERAVESLKTLRHPSVLRYLDSCLAGDTVHLFVEQVCPLSSVLLSQTDLEICSGLQNVLVALDFLHTKAGRVHNNVCRDTIFVTNSGEWKLGCFDLSSTINEVTQPYLDQIRSSRYDKAIPPEDEGNKMRTGSLASSRDIFAYGQLVKETMDKCLESDTVTDAAVFLELATKSMQNSNPAARPTALALSRHPFFNQPLLRAQDFLAEIAIKSVPEKEDFFKKLPALLYAMPENVVGTKLAKTLLGRMVVLNPSAQTHLLPHLLIPRTDPSSEGLFDVANYQQYVLPVLIRIFPVRDAQIRSILLQYFPHYVGLLDRDHLVNAILPELLLGIKDTDDGVVAATLRSLADLVPILGGAAVIGGTRLKLFANGTPKEATAVSMASPSAILTSPKVLVLDRRSRSGSNSSNPLPERHEPDGGEDDAGRRMTAQLVTEEPEEERWSDWEDQEADQEEDCRDPLVEILPAPPSVPLGSKPTTVRRPVILEDDLSALEIQVKSKEDEIDYFADMAPTIVATKPAVVASPPPVQLDFKADDKEEDNDGWNWDD